MADETDLIKLYSSQILALASDIPNLGRLENPDGTARKRSPLCGSTITVDIVVADGRVVEFAQVVKACALGQAAASVVGSCAVGQPQEVIAKGRDQLAAMLTENAAPPEAPFDGLRVLEPARDFKNRHPSILLAFDATLEALDQATQDA